MIIDIEISMVKAFGWSLKDIDETDIDSLLPFIVRFSGKAEMSAPAKRVYCDQVGL